MTGTPETGTPEKSAPERGVRKAQVGKVTSDKGDKSLTVVVQRLVRHPMYDKFLRQRTKLHVHDEKNEAHTGDTVEVMATRPLSKTKRWRLVRVISKAEG